MDLRGRRLPWVVALVVLFAGTVFILRTHSRRTPHAPRPSTHTAENVVTAPESVPALTVDRALALARDPETKGRVLRVLRSGTPEASALLDADREIRTPHSPPNVTSRDHTRLRERGLLRGRMTALNPLRATTRAMTDRDSTS